MNRMIASLAIATLAILFGSCGGGGGGEDCDFALEAFANGANASTQVSEWDCVDSEGKPLQAAFFLDGTGYSSQVGTFTWEKTGCRSFEFVSTFGRGEIVDIDGSIESGVFTATQISRDLGNLSISCVLVLF